MQALSPWEATPTSFSMDERHIQSNLHSNSQEEQSICPEDNASCTPIRTEYLAGLMQLEATCKLTSRGTCS